MARRRGVQQTGRLQTLIVKAQFSAIKMTKFDRIFIKPRSNLKNELFYYAIEQLQTETGNFPNSF